MHGGRFTGQKQVDPFCGQQHRAPDAAATEGLKQGCLQGGQVVQVDKAVGRNIQDRHRSEL